MMEDRCVCCGKIIPEGRMVCYQCEHYAPKPAPAAANKSFSKAKRKAIGFITVFAIIAIAKPIYAANDLNGTTWYACVDNVSIELTFSTDEYTRTIDGREEQGTWTLDGDTLTLDKDENCEMEFTYTDDTFSATVNDIEYVFTKEKEEGFQPSTINQKAEIQDFIGSWKVYEVTSNGITAEPKTLGISTMLVTIKDGKISLSIESDSTSLEQKDISITCKNGTLSFDLEVTGDSTGTGEAYILDDGTMYLSLVSGDTTAGFYLEQSDEAVEKETDEEMNKETNEETESDTEKVTEEANTENNTETTE